MNQCFTLVILTHLINDFLFSLYNENLIRVNDTKFDDKDKQMMMLGIVELKDESNTLYITISEEPETDNNFYRKLGILLNMIEHLFFKSERNSKKIKTEVIKGSNLSYANNRITLIDVTDTDIKNIKATEEYKTSYNRKYNEKYDISNIYKPKDLKTKTAREINIYRNLIKPELKIKFVFNNKYINDRRGNEGISHSFSFLK